MKFNYSLFKEKLPLTFIIILTIQLVSMLIMSQNVGISADEGRHYKQAQKVYNYYKTDGEDQSAVQKQGVDPMHYNGQSFDNLMYYVEKTFDVENNMEMRHFFNALIGWLILLLTGLIAKEMWGYKGAIIAILILFLSPRFLGHALNNNKDIPFAFGFILSFYATIIFLKQLPKLKVGTIIMLIFGIGYAISIRLAGILSIAFLGLFSAIWFFTRKPFFGFQKKEKAKPFVILLLSVPIIAVAGYFLGIIAWPFMMQAPIEHMKEILDATNSHPVALNQLFEGALIQSNKLPDYYSLRYLQISYPLVVLVGMLLFVLLLAFNFKKSKLLNYFMLAFAFTFVFAWMSTKGSNFYGGIRHLLFIYPLAVLLAVCGFFFLLEMTAKFNKKWLNYANLSFLGILIALPAIHIAKNYPYSYVYFNELAGGVKNNFSKYETDYFQHSLRHATEWLKENELKNVAPGDKKVIVATNDNFNTGYFLRDVKDKADCVYTRYYEKSKSDWDYAVFYCGYVSPNQIKNKQWPPKGTIHTETVDGFPIAAVVKRQTKADYNGFSTLKKKDWKNAKRLFSEYLKFNPTSEEVLEGYARVLMAEQKYDSVHYYTDLSLKSNPRQMGALLAKAQTYNIQKQYNNTLTVCNAMEKVKESFPDLYYQRGFALQKLGKPNEALKAYQLAMAYKKDYYQAYLRVGEILMNYKNYKKALEVYTKVLEFRKTDRFAPTLIAKCYHLSNNNKKANEILASLTKTQLQTLDATMVSARIAISVNDMATAAAYLNSARNIHNNSELYVIRAIFQLKNKQPQSAKQYLEKALELNKNNREATELLKQFNKKPTVPKDEKKQQKKSIMFQ